MTNFLRIAMLMLLCSIFSISVQAQSSPVDSIPAGAHLKKSTFIRYYGRDDTSRAMIRRYFNRRRAIYGLFTDSRAALLSRIKTYDSIGIMRRGYRHHVGKTVEREYFKLKKSSFMTRYSKDDSDAALIHIMFADRTLGFLATTSYLTLRILPTLIFVAKPNAGDIFIGDYLTEGLIPLAGSATGTYILLNSTRKKLYHYLLYYKKYGYMHPNIRERIKIRIDKVDHKRGKDAYKARLRQQLQHPEYENPDLFK